ncbi:MAG: sulfotransferase [Tahibacter sp.]
MLQIAVDHLQNGRYAEAEALCRAALQRASSDDAARLFLAISLQAQGRLPEAVTLFAALVATNPDSYEHWNNYGNVLRETRQYPEADNAYRRALQLTGHDPSLLLNIGLNHLESGEPAQAIDWLKAAFELAPHDVEIRVHYASAAFECGEIMRARRLAADLPEFPQLEPQALAEAAWLHYRVGSPTTGEKLIEHAAKVYPNHPLILLRQASLHERSNRLDDAQRIVDQLIAESPAMNEQQSEDLAILRTTLASRGTDLQEARIRHEQLINTASSKDRLMPLYFSLAKVHDRAGDYAAAMQTLELAHRVQVEIVSRRSPKLFSATPLALTQYPVSAEDAANWPQFNETPGIAESPIFIVGFPRSGTTMLETMLDAHPALACMDERPFLQDLIEYMRERDMLYPEDLSKLTANQCTEMRALYWKLVAECVTLQPGQRLIDKNPLNLLKLPLICRLFPNAHIILALRHPCDVLLSNYMQNFFSPSFVAMCATLETTALRYVDAFEFWRNQCDVFAPNVLQLRYEDIVEDIEPYARQIAAFLGLPWHEGMVNFHEHARQRGYISTPSYSQVIEPVYRSSSGRWHRYRKYLEPVIPILRPVAERFGYTF